MVFESMWVLVPAVLLLCFPLDGLLRGEVRFGQVDQMFLRGRKRRLSVWNTAMLAIDPLRAAGGAYLLIAGLRQVDPIGGGLMAEATMPLLMGAILFVALIAQLVTRRDPEYLLAPVGFSAGLIVQLMSPSVAAIALLAGFVALAGVRAWSAYFLVAAVACAGGGFALMELDRVTPLVLGSVLVLPGIAGMLTGRHLMMPGR